VAQVSDAGTPAVCDPGARLVESVREAGFAVVPVAGASAVMAALSVAGVADSTFYFAGFLPAKAGERQKRLAGWQEADFPVVMFETPHRIEATLADMQALFPERRLMLGREISKTFETFLSGTVNDLVARLQEDNNQSRGEMVLVLHPAALREESGLPPEAEKVMKILAAELPTKQAAELASKISGANKKALYDLALEWKKQER
jgi:16S rRNA (cytidine1402-2'-O)-methyltransferase